MFASKTFHFGKHSIFSFKIDIFIEVLRYLIDRATRFCSFILTFEPKNAQFSILELVFFICYMLNNWIYLNKLILNISCSRLLLLLSIIKKAFLPGQNFISSMLVNLLFWFQRNCFMDTLELPIWSSSCGFWPHYSCCTWTHWSCFFGNSI